MTNYLKKLYNFFGSIYFAIILIATTATMVVVGTFVEASTQSHKNASLLTYSTPWFFTLLCGFFVNILLSALRRWPFQLRHVPFLITHLGLLMIIGGVMIKTLFGVQGTIIIMEGSGSHDLIDDSQEALRIEHRNEKGSSVAYVPLAMAATASIPNVSLHVNERVDNSEEILVPWAVGNSIVIRGLDPLPMYSYEASALGSSLPPPHRVRFPHNGIPPHNMWGIRTANVEAVLSRIYVASGHLKVLETETGQPLGEYPLEEAVETPISLDLPGGTRIVLTTDLDLGFHLDKGCVAPHIRAVLRTAESEHLIEVPLDGNGALLNQNVTTPYLGKLPITLDIVMQPLLAIVFDNTTNQTALLEVDPHGSVFSSVDDPKKMEKIYAYDEGFAGYTIQKEIPYAPFPSGREGKEEAIRNYVVEMLEKAKKDDEKNLMPPLQHFSNACTHLQLPFGQNLVAFLEVWSRYEGWLYPESQPLPETLRPIFARMSETWSHEERQAAEWATVLFAKYEPSLKKGIDPIEMLHKEQWPLVDALAKELEARSGGESSADEVLTLLTQQILQAAAYLPKRSDVEKPHNIATEFSAYLRAYGIHLATIAPEIPANDLVAIGDTHEPIVLETPVRRGYLSKAPLVKTEDNIPAVTIAIMGSKKREVIPLVYEKRASGLCWPGGDGSCLLRYQPMVYAIPYHIRLRQARQINYPNTTQPYSYEADLAVKDMRTGDVVMKTISMNRVHETGDGYRFYLSSMYPPEEGMVKSVQIVVNRDPAKYWLTYPGALILTLGIVILFWMRPYKKK